MIVFFFFTFLHNQCIIQSRTSWTFSLISGLFMVELDVKQMFSLSSLMKETESTVLLIFCLTLHESQKQKKCLRA